MTREEKYEIVNELSEKLQSTNYFYITDSAGMTVAQTNAFRRMCFQQGVEYRVVKNTLIAKALETLGTDYSSFKGTVLKGFSGVLIADSGKAPANLLKDFAKKYPAVGKPELKAASIDTALFIGKDQLDILCNLKSKNELLGEVIGLLQSPAQNVISALSGQGQKIAGILKTLEEREG